MGGVLGVDDRAGVHRSARAHPARRGELHRIRAGVNFEPVHPTDRRHGAIYCQAGIRTSSPGARFVTFRRAPWRRRRKRPIVACFGSLLPPAWPRGPGPGRRKDDADGGRVPGSQAYPAYDFCGLDTGQHFGHRVHPRAAHRLGLRTALWHLPRNGGASGGLFWHACRKLVSLDAFGAMMIKQTLSMPALPHHAPQISSLGIGYLVGSFVFLVLLIAALIIFTRKAFRRGSAQQQESRAEAKPGTDNASAFMAASMQGVIEKLRAQEKELARLHLLAQERAQESERLTEEVTRNMPTGLLLVSATGAISSTNPAAEAA